jgi:hypothetical protein
MNNVQTQLKVEKVSSFAKDNMIKSLEEMVLKIGYNPSNVKVVEELIKKNNVDITPLRKKLKLPATEDSHAKEIAERECQKRRNVKVNHGAECTDQGDGSRVGNISKGK